MRVVTYNWGSWDTHSNNFTKLKTQLPQLDIAMSALIEDLEQRGMLDDVSIVMWGEFGRTPRVNSNGGGRDHWPKLAMAFLAGGGMRTGQAIGESTKYAEEALERMTVVEASHGQAWFDIASAHHGRKDWAGAIRAPTRAHQGLHPLHRGLRVLAA